MTNKTQTAAKTPPEDQTTGQGATDGTQGSAPPSGPTAEEIEAARVEAARAADAELAALREQLEAVTAERDSARATAEAAVAAAMTKTYTPEAIAETGQRFILCCDLPNAATEISGVRFTPDRGQMVSEPVDHATAARFAGIDGYRAIPA